MTDEGRFPRFLGCFRYAASAREDSQHPLRRPRVEFEPLEDPDFAFDPEAEVGKLFGAGEERA